MLSADRNLSVKLWIRGPSKKRERLNLYVNLTSWHRTRIKTKYGQFLVLGFLAGSNVMQGLIFDFVNIAWNWNCQIRLSLRDFKASISISVVIFVRSTKRCNGNCFLEFQEDGLARREVERRGEREPPNKAEMSSPCVSPYPYPKLDSSFFLLLSPSF